MTYERPSIESSFSEGVYRGYKVSVRLVRERVKLYKPRSVRSSTDVSAFFREIEESDREGFYSLHLDTRHQIIGCEEISKGTVCSAPVHPREVFKSALLSNAAAIVVCHNHPSGDPSPSGEDREITRRLGMAGDLLGISLLDHVIIGHKCHYSLAEDMRYERGR